ncbi:MAG: hypothetical protein RLZ71_134 [Actinomycetota bacterium]|jgi:4-diphosphocytidyl-2-C-methyl-D-erythritol kinase
MSVTVSAPGKVNLFFTVGSLRADGYHDVVSVYHALNLRETVTVSSASEYSLAISGITDGVPTDDSNLAMRAARLFDTPVSIHIEKHVPVAGGMGGGSADAAAALVAASRLTGREVKLEEVAALGADVPFAILGGTALGTGKGEVLEPVACATTLHWVLVPAAFGLSTPLVYRTLDELRPVANEREVQPLLDALASGDVEAIAANLHNDLQQAALHLKPELQETIDRLEAAGALKAMVSGSGPTIMALAPNSAAAEAIAREVGGIATSGPSEGAI